MLQSRAEGGEAGSGSQITRQEKSSASPGPPLPIPSASQAFGIKRPLAGGLGMLWGLGGELGRLLTEGKCLERGGVCGLETAGLSIPCLQNQNRPVHLPTATHPLAQWAAWPALPGVGLPPSFEGTSE